ncbi:hypothetical protein CYMTET_12217 [Cymbomonas tetramitiformis]|uniref:Tubulin-specific chaperone A n=1 Tax=Cymbomonas tetramitiformis TaxID=36881 RepID=A0AAE0GKQ4_9CHLO|nr:hypothetical protein CYMTET_12217 [Cymbomonas tetramitiformis]|eukprot:gene10782-12757_t
MAARQVKIKTGVLTRVRKELVMYEKEQQKEQKKTDDMKAAGAEEHDIKQQENVLGEAAMMLPETRKRLENALNDLQSCVAENESDLTDSEELVAAQALISEVKPMFE